MRNHRARGAVRRADWGFRGTRFDAFCLRASQSIKNQMCLNSRRRFIFDNCLIMLRSATATKQLGDSVRRCQKTESGAATAPRHEERDRGRPQRHAGGEPARHTSICAARSSTSGVVGGVAHQRLERRTMHRQRERVRRECGARANGASSEARQLRNRNVLDRERIIIRTDTSSEREQNFEDGETEGR